MSKIFLFILLSAFLSFSVYSKENKIFIKEDFNNLKQWNPLKFDKIDRLTKYEIVNEKSDTFVKCITNNSASGIIFKKNFNVYKFRYVKWKWKIKNIFKKGNAKEKDGDDFPVRIYIMFKYNPDKAGFYERMKYGLAKKIYGKYPPHSSLNYIWANKKYNEKIIPNAYTDKAQMILLQSGKKNIGKWVEETIDIIKDYKKAFGEKPPEIASIAIMSDSDNTGESAEAYIDYIEVNKK